jgi:hypothetical protein
MDRVRRVIDRGPLQPDKGRAHSIADYLRSTGLYESVTVEISSVKVDSSAAPDGPDLSFKMGDGEVAPAEKSLDELSSMIDE